MRTAILKYNAGNTASVANALKRLGVEAVVTDDTSALQSADKVIVPGVGEASSAMRYLLLRGLDRAIRSLRQPVLGICLGMQLMCSSSEENETECLGIVPYRARRLPGDGVKVPHVGWNTVSGLRSPLFEGISEEEYFYFVHGFFVEENPESIAACTYGAAFSAGFRHRNFYAVQFHPERSGAAGSRLLENFLGL